MSVQERDGLVELRAMGICADAAVDHRSGRLTGTAELDERQLRLVRASQLEQPVRIAVIGPIRVRGSPIGWTPAASESPSERS
jgi:hypothetical protein